MPAGDGASRAWMHAGLAGVLLFAFGALAFFLRPAVLDAADAPLLGLGGTVGVLAASALAFLGNVEVVGAVLVVACVLLARSGRPMAAVALVAVFLAEETAVHALKTLVARPRPEWALAIASGWSFPSGHAARGGLIAGVLVALLPTARRRALVVGAVAFGLLMGAARVVLGVHHVSDVLAGAGIGLAAAGMGMALLHAAEEKRATVRVEVQGPEEPVAVPPVAPLLAPRDRT